MAHDIENRLVTATTSSAAPAQYGYDPSSERVYSGVYSTSLTETFFFYGSGGQKLLTYNLGGTNGAPQLVRQNFWYGGRLLVTHDQLSSNGKYFPYGEDRTSPSPANPANGVEKFATYTRDAESGLDYAYQRYYTSGLGRFFTPDPIDSSAHPAGPQSWGRYVYAANDPVNHADPSGGYAYCPGDDEESLDGGCIGDGGLYCAYGTDEEGVCNPAPPQCSAPNGEGFLPTGCPGAPQSPSPSGPASPKIFYFLTGPQISPRKVTSSPPFTMCNGMPYPGLAVYAVQYCLTYTLEESVNGGALTPVTSGHYSVSEEVTYASGSGLSTGAITGTAAVNSAGQFLDTQGLFYDSMPSAANLQSTYGSYLQTISVTNLATGQSVASLLDCLNWKSGNLSLTFPNIFGFSAAATCPSSPPLKPPTGGNRGL